MADLSPKRRVAGRPPAGCRASPGAAHARVMPAGAELTAGHACWEEDSHALPRGVGRLEEL